MENTNKILESLNDEQRQAVTATEGPLLIVAGAGSGKTRVLTSRIAYILAGGTDASRILALTFTKKAASEMKERIALMVGARNARSLVMGTFHSVFIRFLRDYAHVIGYPKEFTIYDQSDSTSAMKTVIKELGLDDKIYKPKECLSRISAAKNNLVLPEAYRQKQDLMDSDMRTKRPRLHEVYARYQATLKQNGVMDFDDILVNMNVLLSTNQDAWREIADRFSYIMVDEYQDTNYSQYLILRRLAYYHHNICVVGDDSQSIYAFRGARIENILKFSKDYPEAKVLRLERNYRSTSVIVDAANSVIERNSGRIPKKCYAVGEKGSLIEILRAYNENEESALIAADIIDKMRQSHAQYQDFAILYRTNAQSRAIEEVLRRRNLPYMVYSGNSFFERAEIKDFMAYYKLAVNPSDNESLRRIINKPARGIGDTSMNAIVAVASTRGCSLLEACKDTSALGTMIRGAAMEKLQKFALMIESFYAQIQTTDALDIARKIGDDSGLYAFYKADNSIEGLARLGNIDELINSIASYADELKQEAEENNEPAPLVTLADFIENVSLLSNVDTADDEDDSNRIALMTVHSAKGLEFPYVYIAGMEENLFPSGGPGALPTDIEEERRLFYVALTRAKRQITLSFAGERMRNGQHNSNSPSRFLKEIDSQFLLNPLCPEDFEASGISFGGGYGRFGGAGGGSYGRFGGAGGGSYGRSSAPVSMGRSSGAGNLGRSSSVGSMGSSNAAGRGAGIPAGTRTASAITKPDVIDPNFVPCQISELKEGLRVEHIRFGAGRIEQIEGVFPELKASIVFDHYGPKTILLKYAKLRLEKK